MAAQADVVGPGLRRVTDSTAVPVKEWDDLMAGVRSRVVDLVCPNCHARLGGRRSARGTQHFYHWPGESPDCVNRSHEGESDQHRELADLLARDIETIGGRAEREWRFTGGVADVAAWPKTGRGSTGPSSIIELERKADSLAEYVHRDQVRMAALSQDSDGYFGRRSVVWMAHNQHAATYLRLPQLYLSQDAGRVTDGAFHIDDGVDAQPVVLDRLEALNMVMDGRMARVHDAIHRGQGEFGDAWIILRTAKVGAQRGRRRRAAPPADFVPSATECHREPSVAEELFPGMAAPKVPRRSTPTPFDPSSRRWPLCSVCGGHMTAGQRGAHFACGGA